MKKLYIIPLLLIASLFVVGCVPNDGFVGSSSDNRTTKASTVVYTVGPYADVTIAPTSTSRVFTRITTTSTVAYVSFNGAYNTTTRERLESPFVIDLDHLYTGSIRARADATTTISVTEFTN
jgi:hypothetical protein